MATLWTTVLVSNRTKLLHGAHTAVVRHLHTLILNMNVGLSFGFYNDIFELLFFQGRMIIQLNSVKL